VILSEMGAQSALSFLDMLHGCLRSVGWKGGVEGFRMIRAFVLP
jgi:hypothetical protein